MKTTRWTPARQFEYLNRFYNHLESIEEDELEASRRARGTKKHFEPYERMVVMKLPDYGIKQYYIPLDFVNTIARIIILGIGPDYNTMFRAYSYAIKRKPFAYRNGVLKIRGLSVALTRNFLYLDDREAMIRMLDELGINQVLGLHSCSELFSTNPNLLHLTSVMRYPTFKNGISYAGQSPELLGYRPFREDIVETRLSSELESVNEALIIPLGDVANDVLLHLISKGRLDYRRCLLGFPGPDRFRGKKARDLFDERKEFMKRKVGVWSRLVPSRGIRRYRYPHDRQEYYFRVFSAQRPRQFFYGISFIKEKRKDIWKAVCELPSDIVVPKEHGLAITHNFLSSRYFSGSRSVSRKLKREGIVLSPMANSISELVAITGQFVSWDRVIEWLDCKKLDRI